MEQANNNSLEAAFRKSLLIIKPYIECLTNTKFISQYQIWLEKLSDTSLSEKKERNIYLEELRKQIEAGKLEEPFTRPPPYGPLQPYHEFFNNTPKNSESETDDSLAYSEEKRHFVTCTKIYEAKPSPRIYSDLTGYYQLQKEQENVQNNHSILPKQQYAAKERREDTSWYDLTEVSTSTIMVEESGSARSTVTDHCHGDDRNRPNNLPVFIEKRNAQMEEYYRTRMYKMTELIEKLQEENRLLYENLAQIKKDLTLKNAKAEKSIHNLTEEVNTLQKRLQELSDIKAVLQNGKRHSHNMERDLHATMEKNMELQAIISALEKKLKSERFLNNKENTESKKKLTKLHNEEIQMLKQLHAEQFTMMESKFKAQISEKEYIWEGKIVELKKEYDNRVLELKIEHEKLVAEKDSKIRELQFVIREQFAKIEDQISIIQEFMNKKDQNHACDRFAEKMHGLEKAVTRVFIKQCTKDSKKQIIKLQNELDIQKKNLELQMSAQKATLLARVTAEKQGEIDEVLNKLEARYKMLLNKLQNQMVTAKISDEKTISDLRREIIYCKAQAQNRM